MRNVAGKAKRRRPGRPASTEIRKNLVLLEAAQSAFARHGFEGASLRGIAAAAGVDPALVAHHFGSKEALWEAVVERLASRLAPLIAELQSLVERSGVSIRIRLEKALKQLISMVCEEPEFGMFLSRIGPEKSKRLNFLVRKLVRPCHNAFRPLLLEAMRKRVIGTQPVEILCFMLLQAITMTVSYRHILEHCGGRVGDLEQLKAGVMRCVHVTFLDQELKRSSIRA